MKYIVLLPLLCQGEGIFLELTGFPGKIKKAGSFTIFEKAYLLYSVIEG